MLRPAHITLLALALCCTIRPAHAQELDLKTLLKNGGIRVEREDGTPLLTYRDEQSFIPASTLKVATTFCALESMGRDYRFVTNFYRGKGNTLYIQGSGDPSLVSEELSLLAAKVAPLFPVIETISIDHSSIQISRSMDHHHHSTLTTQKTPLLLVISVVRTLFVARAEL